MTQPQAALDEKTGANVGTRIDIAEILIAMGEEKKRLAWVTLGATIFALIACLVWPKTYTARTVLLPPQSGQNTSASVLATLGVLSASGLASATSLKSPEELYVSLLKSRTIADALIAQFGLQERYNERLLTDARTELTKRVSISGERKSGLVVIDVEDGNPAFSADLANAYADQLRHLMTRVAVTDAQQRRLYLEQQVQRSKKELANAEGLFQRAQGKSGLQSIDVSAQGAIRAAAELRARITSLEIELRTMSAYTTPGNPDAQRITAELSSLREHLAKIERGDGFLSHLTEDGLDNVRAYRELKYQEVIVASLIAQYEAARAEEAKEAPLVQQVDVAIVPDKKSRPKTVTVVVISAFGALVAAVLLLLIQRAWCSSFASEPSSSRGLRLLRAWNLDRN
jgi:tyrosine-protein kinase Etk/Wzc